MPDKKFQSQNVIAGRGIFHPRIPIPLTEGLQNTETQDEVAPLAEGELLLSDLRTRLTQKPKPGSMRAAAVRFNPPAEMVGSQFVNRLGTARRSAQLAALSLADAVEVDEEARLNAIRFDAPLTVEGVAKTHTVSTVLPEDRWWRETARDAAHKSPDYQRSVLMPSGKVGSHIRVTDPVTGVRRYETRDENGQRLSPDEAPLYDPLAFADVDLLTDPETGPVVLVEGVVAADALIERGIPVMATLAPPGGVLSEAAFDKLKGRDVIVWPDADDEGLVHMAKATLATQRAGAIQTRWIKWADSPQGGDAADFNGGGEAVIGILATAEIVPPLALARLGFGIRAESVPSPLRLRPPTSVV